MVIQSRDSFLNKKKSACVKKSAVLVQRMEWFNVTSVKEQAIWLCLCELQGGRTSQALKTTEGAELSMVEVVCYRVLRGTRWWGLHSIGKYFLCICCVSATVLEAEWGYEISQNSLRWDRKGSEQENLVIVLWMAWVISCPLWTLISMYIKWGDEIELHDPQGPILLCH